MFHLGEFSMQWKRISNMSPAAYTVCTGTNSLLLWLNIYYCVPTTCLCVCHCILKCVYVLKRGNTMWLGSITCMTIQIVWYNCKWGRIQRKENYCTLCLVLCAHAWVKLCGHTFCMWLHCCDMRTNTASSTRWGDSPTSFLTWNTFTNMPVALMHDILRV